MIIFKDSVKLFGVQKEIISLIDQLHLYFRSVLNLSLIITSVTDGKHCIGSKHYTGHAIDLRIWHMSENQLKTFQSFFLKNFDKNYDFVREKDHIHIEYEPH